MNLQRKINKLVKALNNKGYICLFNKEQFYSSKLSKVCTINKVFHLMPVEEYNKLYPDDKKNPDKYEFVKDEIIKSFKQEEILLKLVEIYKKVGDSSG
jgi:hypothetical protein